MHIPKFARGFVSKITGSIFDTQGQKTLKKIKVPTLKQSAPLLTSFEDVSAARARVLKLNQDNRFLLGACIQTNRGLRCTLGLVFCRELTRAERRALQEAVGNVSTEFSAQTTHPCHYHDSK